ncbi:MAG: hypothetical protein K0Q59_1869 [Paenibacillus sp.]|nr:hypothetical protein [Paenibacillus sp.]
MHKAQHLIGLPVIEVRTGKQLGTAKDCVIDREWNIRGILLESKSWFSSPRYIAWEHIVNVGEDAVTVEHDQVVQERDDSDTDTFLLLDGSFKLKGLPVITVDGNSLGLIEDVYFGEKMDKQIVGYELSDGFISDLKEGRKWLPFAGTVVLGEDAVIVPASCVVSNAII